MKKITPFVNKRILVAGGAGFLGSHLCETLLNQTQAKIICMDNFYTGSWRNIQAFADHPRFQFIEHDITETLPDLVGVQEIYNLACPASPVHYQKDPVYTLKTNVWGIYNLLELAKAKQARILQASTSEIYGDPEIHPQPEDYWGHVNPNGIRSCYDEGKRCAETLLYDYNRQYNLSIKVARIFNTYGPRMQTDDGRVVSNFIIQALKEEPLTVYGQGQQTRSFCYVDDLVEGLISLMQSSQNFIQPINLGNPREMTVLDAAQTVLKYTGSPAKIVYKDLPSDDPKRRRPNIERAKTILGWQPNVAFEEGVQKTIDYFRRYLEQNDTPFSNYEAREGVGRGGVGAMGIG